MTRRKKMRMKTSKLEYRRSVYIVHVINSDAI
jgi:hypothetical protein